MPLCPISPSRTRCVPVRSTLREPTLGASPPPKPTAQVTMTRDVHVLGHPRRAQAKTLSRDSASSHALSGTVTAGPTPLLSASDTLRGSGLAFYSTWRAVPPGMTVGR